MLPDFLKIKRKVLKSVSGAVSHRTDSDPFLGEIPRHTQHEGNRSTIVREDGTELLLDFREPVAASVSISTDEIRQKGSHVTRTATASLANDFAQVFAKRVMESLKEATEEIGNTVDSKGQPFSQDLVLESLRKMELSFDDEGNWMPPTLVIHPQHSDAIGAILKKAETDTAFIRERDIILRQKREEWYARETNRRLVD